MANRQHGEGGFEEGIVTIDGMPLSTDIKRAEELARQIDFVLDEYVEVADAVVIHPDQAKVGLSAFERTQMEYNGGAATFRESTGLFYAWGWEDVIPE